MKILVINGQNLNLLGLREKEIYGESSYEDLLQMIQDYCDKEKIDVEFFQSNHEGALVDEIQKAHGVYDGIVINPAAYTHTRIPTVEVHISDVNNREEFRKTSYVSLAAAKTIAGEGFAGYLSAIRFLQEIVQKSV